METRPFPTEGLVGRLGLALTLRPPDLGRETLSVVGCRMTLGRFLLFV